MAIGARRSQRKTTRGEGRGDGLRLASDFGKAMGADATPLNCATCLSESCFVIVVVPIRGENSEAGELGATGDRDGREWRARHTSTRSIGATPGVNRWALPTRFLTVGLVHE